ncbi:hypothetical protein [Ruania zhangjianzhongii]|uniref:hypothetical protein n=1 Tax=Ruania zhangjianzhongii TaxID=2603206 RepID=UPI0011CCCE4A|nr:hypothetical protein [Ruania zhangjianzhongii]
MTDLWTPPDLSPEEAAAFVTPGVGLPTHAREPLLRWITNGKYDHDPFRWSVMVDFQNASRQDHGFLVQNEIRTGDAITALRKLDLKRLTYLLDYLLMLQRPVPGFRPNPPDRVEALDAILRAAGAGWRVGDRGGRWGLVAAVNTGVERVVAEVVSSADRAAALLKSAWDAAFGVTPQASHAYHDAVRAVEVYSCPLFSTKDKSATLGKDIAVIRSRPEAWSFALAGSRNSTGVEQLVSAMQLLWHSHTDRHGREDYEDVSIEAARAAVLLASTLVGWFSLGLVKRS